jgi:hypothetical protein
VPRPCVFCARAGTTLLVDEIFWKVKPGAASRIVPTLRKMREEWGTHLYLLSAVKGLAIRQWNNSGLPHPKPALSEVEGRFSKVGTPGHCNNIGAGGELKRLQQPGRVRLQSRRQTTPFDPALAAEGELFRSKALFPLQFRPILLILLIR